MFGIVVSMTEKVIKSETIYFFRLIITKSYHHSTCCQVELRYDMSLDEKKTMFSDSSTFNYNSPVGFGGEQTSKTWRFEGY